MTCEALSFQTKPPNSLTCAALPPIAFPMNLPALRKSPPKSSNCAASLFHKYPPSSLICEALLSPQTIILRRPNSSNCAADLFSSACIATICAAVCVKYALACFSTEEAILAARKRLAFSTLDCAETEPIMPMIKPAVRIVRFIRNLLVYSFRKQGFFSAFDQSCILNSRLVKLEFFSPAFLTSRVSLSHFVFLIMKSPSDSKRSQSFCFFHPEFKKVVLLVSSR